MLMSIAAAGPGQADPSDEGAIAALCAHPRFADAVRHIGARYLAMHADCRIHKLVADEGRFLICQYAICLHAGHDPRLPGSGLTLGQLVRQCTAFGIMAHGRVEAMVALLRRNGRLLDAPPGPDKRLRRLMPSPEMEAEFRDRLRYHLAALDIVMPGRGYLARLEADPGFFWAFERHRGSMVAALPSLRLRLPGLVALAHVEGGYLVMMALIQAIEGLLRPSEIGFPVADQAARLGLSRTQLARVLESLAQMQLIENVEGRVRQVRIMPEAIETMLAWHAIRLLRHDRNSARAAAECDGLA